MSTARLGVVAAQLLLFVIWLVPQLKRVWKSSKQGKKEGRGLQCVWPSFSYNLSYFVGSSQTNDT